jgi:alpha-L-fucosidase 2
MKHSSVLLAAITSFMSMSATGMEAQNAGADAVRPPSATIAFDAPARDIIAEGFPIGNGRMGMLVTGGVAQESDAVCEDSMWSGWRNDQADKPDAAKALPEIRSLFEKGEVAKAQDLINKTQISRMDDGDGHNTYDAYGTYEMLARLEIATNLKDSDARDYARWLDMTTGTVHVTYTVDDIRYTRTYYASRPDEVQVIEFTASKPGQITFNATLARPDTHTTITADGENAILLSGFDPSPYGKSNHGLEYACRLGANATGGTLEVKDGALSANACDSVLLYITARTNYKGITAWPDYLDNTQAHLTRSLAELEAARRENPSALHARHAADVGKLFGKTSLQLGCRNYDAPDKPLFHSSTALDKAKKGDLDPQLVETYFHFGRYLLISSSREGDLPANLQGIWTVNYKDEKSGKWSYYTPWNGDYHANVNIQMNYWPAHTANLAECANPLYDFISALPGPGGITAKVQHGCDGWTTHTMNNIWGYTSPGWQASWGHFPMAGPWLATHIWTGYAYTLDKDFLARMWPTLKGSAQFVLSWLVQDKDGYLVSGPSESPENRFTLPDGTTGYFCMGPSMDQELCAQLLDETVRSAQILGIEADFAQKCETALAKIRPVGIGPDGRLLEWTEQYDEPEPGHRHTSHLFGLYPGSTISTDTTPELAAAARKSLEYRIAHGGGYTGWSRAMMIGEWARLRDGEKAYENLKALLAQSTLPNLFDTHPPFQIDGNFGATAAMIEMLMQSTLERDGSTTILLLPALPAEWSAGRINGVVAQGNVKVDIVWAEGRLQSATFTVAKDIMASIISGTERTKVNLKSGVPFVLNGSASLH